MKIRFGLSVALYLMSVLTPKADVIYLKNGSVMVADKSWIEGEDVKYQTSSGIKEIPLAEVKRIQEQKSAPVDPSHDQPVRAEVIRGTPASALSPTIGKNNSTTATEDGRESARSSRFKDSRGYEQALRLQKTTGKPIALYFYTDWCGYCARLDRTILIQPEVKQYLESILYVSVNPEHGKADETLFKRFNGRGFPTFLLLGKDQPPRGIPTYVSPATFLQACKTASQPEK